MEEKERSQKAYFDREANGFTGPGLIRQPRSIQPPDSSKMKGKQESGATVSERILRRTTSFEVIERGFTTEPKLRIRRGHNIGIRRCYMIAAQLKDMGFKQNEKISREDLANAVFRVAGVDHRTANRYVGIDIFNKKTGVSEKHIKGYLERLRIIERCGNGLYEVSFLGVPESFFEEGFNHTIGNLCVQGFGTHKSVMDYADKRERQHRDITTTTHNTHTNQSGESTQKRVTAELRPLEARVLDVARQLTPAGKHPHPK